MKIHFILGVPLSPSLYTEKYLLSFPFLPSEFVNDVTEFTRDEIFKIPMFYAKHDIYNLRLME